MDEKQIMTKALKEKDVKFLVKWFFKEDITDLQAVLIRKIAFQEHKKMSICAMTRWGKTYCVSRGIAIYILLNKDKKIIFLGPQREQASILRDYMSELVLKCPSLLEIAEIETEEKSDRLKKEASKSRLTFKNGCEYRVFSCHGTGANLMGFGLGTGGILVKDESCLIPDEANAKIMRMLGDAYEESMIIELYNPWDRSNKTFDHYISPDWFKFHVGWEEAVKDGRVTKEFIEQQRNEMTPLEFTVLYDSNFPQQSEDSLFDLDKINEAIKKWERPEPKDIEGTITISCDVSDKGKDLTVIMVGTYIAPSQYNPNKGTPFRVYEIITEDQSENMALAGKLINLLKNYYRVDREYVINIDCIGVGAGVLSRVQEEVKLLNYGNVKVNGCHFGQSPLLQKERFLNTKSMNYFRLKELMDEGYIMFPNNKQLVKELVAIKWEFTGSSKIRIIDPDKSPDFADALVYFVWYNKPAYKPYITG